MLAGVALAGVVFLTLSLSATGAKYDAEDGNRVAVRGG